MKKILLLSLLALLGATLTAGPAMAFDDEKKSKKRSAPTKDTDEKKKNEDDEKTAPIVLKDGLVMTMAGRTLRRGSVVLENGKIEAVGEDVEIPEGATVVDCRGKTILPGFVPAIAWGVGLGSGRFGFMADLDPSYQAEHAHGPTGQAAAPTPPDCAACDTLAGHAHSTEGGVSYLDGDVGYVASSAAPHGIAHSPGCVCADIDMVFRAQNMPASGLSRLKLWMPDDRALMTAALGAWTTHALPGIDGMSAGVMLGVDSGAADAIKGRLNPHGHDITMLNAAGVTTVWLPGTGGAPEFAMLFGAVTPPTAGTQGVALKMARDRLDDMFVASGRFLVMDFRRMYGLRRHKLLRELEDVKDYIRDKAAYDEAKAEHKKKLARWKKDKKAKKKDLGKEPKKPKTVKKPSAASKWMPLFEKKRALRVFAERVPDIRLALHIAERYGLEVVIDDATEAWAIAGEVAKAGASVVLNPRRRVDRTRRPIRPNANIFQYGWNLEGAGILSKAGVTVAVVPPGPLIGTVGIPGRDLMTLPLDAAFAVRGGMDRTEALKAITLNSAEILGLADRIGSLEVGKDADVIVMDGDPFDHKTFVERTYVDGRLTYDKEKETIFDYVKRGKVVKPVWEWRKPVKKR